MILDSIWAPDFSQAPRHDMYRAWVYPDLHPDEPQPRLGNWFAEDLWAYCGIGTADPSRTSGDHQVPFGITREEIAA